MSKSNFIPQYRLIYNNLKTKIQSGVYSPDSQLPCERILCEQYDVKRITVRKALDMLVQDGLIYKHPGRGSFVCPKEVKRNESAVNGTLLFVMNKSKNDIQNNSSAANAQLFFLMEQIFRKKGYNLLYAGISNENDLTALMEQYSVEGAFLVSTVSDVVIETLVKAELPALCINHYDPKLLSILPDNQSGIRMLVERLVHLGHRRIAFVCGAQNSINAQERLQGYLSAINEFSLTPDPNLIVEGNWTYEGSQASVTAMLQALPKEEYPTAIVAASDMMAMGAIAAAAEFHLKVPDNISIVGFDNSNIGLFCSPQLTSVGADIEQMGSIAAEHLLTMLQRPANVYDRYTIRLPIACSDRGSTGEAKGSIFKK